MASLIEITSVPIEIEMKVSHARLEYTRGTADLEISRQDGGLSIKSRPIRLNIDTFESRNSVHPTVSTAVKNGAMQGQQAAYAATAAYAQQGQLLLEAKVDPQVAAQFSYNPNPNQVPTNVGIDFIPSVGPEIEWDPAVMNIRFEMDKLNFDWRMNQQQFEFIPGDIEISVTQQPDVIIKYVGGPLYVPPSSDPNYEPIDVKA